MTVKLRLLPFITDLGARQMALDEALLELAERPTLRVYGWSEPTLSLGYFQDYGRIHASLPAQDPPAIVRRITGGGAIWHEHEVTYCLVGRRGADGIPAEARRLYGRLHRAILTAIGRQGGEPVDIALQPHTTGDRRYHDEPRCFASPAADDLVARSGGKILGSAARTRGDRILVHGSLKLGSNRWDGGAVAGCGLAREAAAAALIEGVAEALGVVPADGALADGEAQARNRILAARYSSSDWVVRRSGPRP